MRPMFRSAVTAPDTDLQVLLDPAATTQANCCWVVAHANGAPYGRTRSRLGRPRRERHYSTKTAAVAAIWRMGPDAIAVARAGQLTTPCRHHTKSSHALLAG